MTKEQVYPITKIGPISISRGRKAISEPRSVGGFSNRDQRFPSLSPQTKGRA